MDQEAEEGKDKTGPDKRGETPQVSKHAACMGNLTCSGGSAMLLGSIGVMVAPLNYEGFGIVPLTFPPCKCLWTLQVFLG